MADLNDTLTIGRVMTNGCKVVSLLSAKHHKVVFVHMNESCKKDNFRLFRYAENGNEYMHANETMIMWLPFAKAHSIAKRICNDFKK